MDARLPLLPRRVRVAMAVAVAAGILFASVVDPPGRGPPPLGPFGLVGLDKWLHALAYGGLAGAVAYAIPAVSGRQLAAAVGVAATFGLAVEGLQLGLPERAFDAADVGVNALGALAAAAGWRALRVERWLRPWPPRAGAGESPGDTGD